MKMFKWGDAEDYIDIEIVSRDVAHEWAIRYELKVSAGQRHLGNVVGFADKPKQVTDALRQEFAHYAAAHDMAAHRQDIHAVARCVWTGSEHDSTLERYGFMHLPPMTAEANKTLKEIRHRRGAFKQSQRMMNDTVLSIELRRISMYAAEYRDPDDAYSRTDQRIVFAEMAIYPLLSAEDAAALHAKLVTKFRNDYAEAVAGGVQQIIRQFAPNATDQLTRMMYVMQTDGVLLSDYPSWVHFLDCSFFNINPRWRTDAVQSLAAMICAGHYDRAPILRDALLDADCDDEDLITVLALPPHYWAFKSELMQDLAGKLSQPKIRTENLMGTEWQVTTPPGDVPNEMESPSAISIPFDSLPDNLYITGSRYRVPFSRDAIPRSNPVGDEIVLSPQQEGVLFTFDEFTELSAEVYERLGGTLPEAQQQVNDQVLTSLGVPAAVFAASASVNEFTRARLREDGLMRRLLPPEPFVGPLLAVEDSGNANANNDVFTVDSVREQNVEDSGNENAERPRRGIYVGTPRQSGSNSMYAWWVDQVARTEQNTQMALDEIRDADTQISQEDRPDAVAPPYSPTGRLPGLTPELYSEYVRWSDHAEAIRATNEQIAVDFEPIDREAFAAAITQGYPGNGTLLPLPVSMTGEGSWGVLPPEQSMVTEGVVAVESLQTQDKTEPTE